MYNKNAWESMDANKKQEVFSFCEEYKKFLDNSKTERLALNSAIKLVENNGFCDIQTKESLQCGDKVYFNNRGKGLFCAVIGKRPITDGIRFVISHIDAPRLDLKGNPIYEDSDMALLKTHYYGGIKKYQWTTVPLSLIGVVVTKDGKTIDVSVGEEENDPIFCISDLLPHLANMQMQKKMSEGVEGEKLTVICGSIPDDAEKDPFKHAVLSILAEKYGIEEEDFVSAEIEAVPAYRASDVGFDRSIIGAYGQDDRVCAYTALQAICETNMPEYTAACVLVDKEEIGSMGNTGMKSAAFEYAVSLLIKKAMGTFNEFDKMTTLRNSQCISGDVSAAIDPNYPEVNDKQNAAVFGHGPVLTKFTGARGKSGTSDANAEFVADVRSVFETANVHWQIGELGKVDAGGGGTIAQYAANLDIQVIDCGTALLSMHAPFELASKADIYMTYKAYKAFLNR